MYKMPEMMDIDNLGTGILVFDRKKRILLGKRIGKSYRAGMYGVPGGRIMRGESVILSAKRELKEETGLTAKTLNFIGIVNDNQRKRTFIHMVFVCKAFGGKVTTLEPDKCEEWKWFELEKLPKNIMPGHLAGIKMYKENTNLIELL